MSSGAFTMATEGAGSETDGSWSSSEIQRSSPDESCFYRGGGGEGVETERVTNIQWYSY